MLKKMFKSVMIAGLIIGLSNLTVAGEETLDKAGEKTKIKVGGLFQEYFGRFDPGTDGTTPRYQARGEANVRLNIEHDKFRVFFELESRNDEFVSATQRKVSYISPIGYLSIGTVLNIGTVPFNYGGGTKTSQLDEAAWWCLSVAGYSENDGIDLLLPIGPVLLDFTIWDKATATIRNALVEVYQEKFNKAYAAYGLTAPTMTTNKGMTMAIGSNIILGPAKIVLGYMTETIDDYDSDSDDALGATYINMGFLVNLGQIEVSANYSSAKMEYMKDADEWEMNATNFMVSMADLGPGKLIVDYETAELKNTVDYEEIGVIYEMPIDKNIGYQLLYLSETSTTDAGDSTTKTYIGGGLFAAF